MYHRLLFPCLGNILKKALVVLSTNKEKIEEKINSFPLKISINPDFPRGMLSSVQKGFQEVPENSQAVLVVLGDQPSISSAAINKIIKTKEKTGKGIVLLVFQNDGGHPVLIDMK